MRNSAKQLLGNLVFEYVLTLQCSKSSLVSRFERRCRICVTDAGGADVGDFSIRKVLDPNSWYSFVNVSSLTLDLFFLRTLRSVITQRLTIRWVLYRHFFGVHLFLEKPFQLGNSGRFFCLRVTRPADLPLVMFRYVLSWTLRLQFFSANVDSFLTLFFVSTQMSGHNLRRNFCVGVLFHDRNVELFRLFDVSPGSARMCLI